MESSDTFSVSLIQFSDYRFPIIIMKWPTPGNRSQLILLKIKSGTDIAKYLEKSISLNYRAGNLTPNRIYLKLT